LLPQSSSERIACKYISVQTKAWLSGVVEVDEMYVSDHSKDLIFDIGVEIQGVTYSGCQRITIQEEGAEC